MFCMISYSPFGCRWKTCEITIADQIVAMFLNAEARVTLGHEGRDRIMQWVVHDKWNHPTSREGTLKECAIGSISDPFPPFNPQADISNGQFVALSVVREEVGASVPFM